MLHQVKEAYSDFTASKKLCSNIPEKGKTYRAQRLTLLKNHKNISIDVEAVVFKSFFRRFYRFFQNIQKADCNLYYNAKKEIFYNKLLMYMVSNNCIIF